MSSALLTNHRYSTGSAGLIQTISSFAHHTWSAAVVDMIAMVGWVIQGLGNLYSYRRVVLERVRTGAIVVHGVVGNFALLGQI